MSTISLLSMRVYGSVLAVPGVWLGALASTVAAIASSGRLIALVLLVEGATGSFAAGGAAAAASALGAAVVAPVRGRLVDRFGTRRVVPPMAIVHLSAWLLVALFTSDLDLSAVVALSFVAGASFPPVFACVRAGFSRVFAGGERQTPAYALLATLNGVGSVTGPVLAGILVQLWSPRIAMILLIAVTAAGIASLLVWDRSEPVGSGAPAATFAAHLFGPFALRDFRRVAYLATALGGVLGAAQVGAVATFTDSGGWVPGVLVGALAGGEIVGAAAYGALTLPWSQWLRCLAAFLAIAGCGIGLFLAADSPMIAAGIFALGGALSAPVTVAVMNLVDETGGASRRTEAFSWVASTELVGMSLGAATAGILAEHTAGGGFLIISVVSVIAAAAAFSGEVHARSRPPSSSVDPSIRPIGKGV